VKKKVLILLAFFVFLLPLNQQVLAVAPVASKVVNQTAKKIAKEAIKDSAVQMSFSMVMDYKYVPKDEREKAKAGYELICMPANKKPSGECDRPMQVKKDMTESDKKALASKVESKLDTKIAGGLGATKWGKFLDLLVPIFAVGMGVSVIQHALDSDVASLFDEIAYESLLETGDLEVFDSQSEIDESIALSGYSQYIDYFEEKRTEYSQKFWIVKTGVDAVWEFNDNGTKVRDSWLIYTTSPLNPPPTYIQDEVNKYKGGNAAASLRFDSLSNIKLVRASGEVIQPVGPILNIPRFNETGLPSVYPGGHPRPLIAPGAIPFEDINTGEPIYPYKKQDGTIGFKDKIGNEVDENNVLAKDPVITTNPDGSQTVHKAPSFEDRNPTPDKDGIIPPIGKDETVPDFPEGETCTATLKLPKFALLFRTMSESFPFSIPWDLKSGFDALFSEMGKEKPSFKYDLKVNNKVHSIDITMPDYFESWMPFAHTMLLFVFDVGILYGIYRLIGGAS